MPKENKIYLIHKVRISDRKYATNPQQYTVHGNFFAVIYK